MTLTSREEARSAGLAKEHPCNLGRGWRSWRWPDGQRLLSFSAAPSRLFTRPHRHCFAAPHVAADPNTASDPPSAHEPWPLQRRMAWRAQAAGRRWCRFEANSVFWLEASYYTGTCAHPAHPVVRSWNRYVAAMTTAPVDGSRRSQRGGASSLQLGRRIAELKRRVADGTIPRPATLAPWVHQDLILPYNTGRCIYAVVPVSTDDRRVYVGQCDGDAFERHAKRVRESTTSTPSTGTVANSSGEDCLSPFELHLRSLGSAAALHDYFVMILEHLPYPSLAAAAAWKQAAAPAEKFWITTLRSALNLDGWNVEHAPATLVVRRRHGRPQVVRDQEVIAPLRGRNGRHHNRTERARRAAQRALDLAGGAVGDVSGPTRPIVEHIVAALAGALGGGIGRVPGTGSCFQYSVLHGLGLFYLGASGNPSELTAMRDGALRERGRRWLCSSARFAQALRAAARDASPRAFGDRLRLSPDALARFAVPSIETVSGAMTGSVWTSLSVHAPALSAAAGIDVAVVDATRTNSLILVLFANGGSSLVHYSLVARRLADPADAATALEWLKAGPSSPSPAAAVIAVQYNGGGHFNPIGPPPMAPPPSLPRWLLQPPSSRPSSLPRPPPTRMVVFVPVELRSEPAALTAAAARLRAALTAAYRQSLAWRLASSAFASPSPTAPSTTAISAAASATALPPPLHIPPPPSAPTPPPVPPSPSPAARTPAPTVPLPPPSAAEAYSSLQPPVPAHPSEVDRVLACRHAFGVLSLAPARALRLVTVQKRFETVLHNLDRWRATTTRERWEWARWRKRPTPISSYGRRRRAGG